MNDQPRQMASAGGECCRSLKFELGTVLADVDDETGARMSLQLQMEQMPGFLAARFTGAGTPGEASGQFELIAEHCRRTNNDRLLIDTTEYEVKVSVADRFLMGERAQIFARCRIKVAFVCKQEQIDPRKFGTLVAQNRGVSIDVFTDFQSAKEWLLTAPTRSKTLL